MRAILGLLLVTTAAHPADPCVSVTEQKRPDGIDLVATLTHCTEVTITVTAELGENLKSLLPETTDSAGRTRFTVASFRQVDRARAWRLESWHQNWQAGRRLPSIPPPVTYALPFRGEHRILQGPRGTFSHGAGTPFEEAYDFELAEGTPVLAARTGVVVGWRADSTEGGRDPAFAHDSNYVIIRHDDGTFANYGHLQHDGVEVKLGARVEAGDVIARSGNTGFSAQPHLHLDLFYTVDGKTRVTLPLRFLGLTGD